MTTSSEHSADDPTDGLPIPERKPAFDFKTTSPRNTTPSTQARWGDVLEVRPFPSVVSGLQVRELRRILTQARSGNTNQNSNPSPDAESILEPVRNFLGAYLGFDARSAFAVAQTVESLAHPGGGETFWLNGVYGSGKSHLLGVLSLLCDSAVAAPDIQSSVCQEFASHFPTLLPLVQQFRPRVVLHISLDEYSAAQFGLEEIFWRELDAELERQNLEPVEIPRHGSRAESFSVLETSLVARGRFGLVVLLDELSLFLGGRERKALQTDAAFLQFLGQYARRSTPHLDKACPIVVVGAIQKTLEHIADLETYALHQIADRYNVLSLSLAHLPSLVEQRLVNVRDEPTLNEWCEQSFDSIAAALPRLDFGPHEWRSLAPFHPATIALLEQVTSRFFSRTRSAALFCSQNLNLMEPLSQRIGPEEIWDYFFPDLNAHPDLRPLSMVWDNWSDFVATLGGADAAVLSRAMKVLLVCKIAGVVVTPIALANALLLDVGLGGESSYEWARQLLEKLRRNAPFLAVERAEDTFSDRYTIDLGRRVSDLARRQIVHISHELAAGDARLGEAALRSCRDEPLPLAELGEGRSVSIRWAHSPRQITVAVWDGASPSTLANRVGATRELGSRDEAFLLFVPPLVREQFDMMPVVASLEDERTRAAFWVWQPRLPSRDELDLCREVAAIQLASGDPALLDNRRGRAILEHLGKEALARSRTLGQVVTRLFLEGEIKLGNGAVLEASELARGETFASLLESVADFTLPQLYPRFADIAPRARLLTPSNADTLALEVLRRPLNEPFFAPSLERLARHIAEPLGLAKAASGRWKMAAGHEPLVQNIKDTMGEGAAYAQLEATFAKSEWGLTPELWGLLLAGLLRAGEVCAFDARGQELAVGQIGLPLRRSIHWLRPGTLPDGATWTRLAQLAHELWDGTLRAVSFEEVARFTKQLESWCEEMRRFLELSQARAMQLRRHLKHEASSWEQFDAVCSALATVLTQFQTVKGAHAWLRYAASLDPLALREAQSRFLQFAESLEKRLPVLLATHSLLLSPDLVTPSELKAERGEILEVLMEGEALLETPELLERLERWRLAYAKDYAEWHRSQHDPARGLSLKRLMQSDELRAVERLALLRNRSWNAGVEIRQALEAELDKICPRDGALDPGASVCASCGLKLGERVRLARPQDIETRLQAALSPLRESLASEPIRLVLARTASPLLEWDGEGASLLALLSNATLQQLDEALAPRRRVVRSLDGLTSALQACRTRDDYVCAFRSWLDASENLNGDDEVLLS